MDRNRRPLLGVRSRARLTLASTVFAALGFSTPSRAVVPYQGWTPASFGMVSECGRDDVPYGYVATGCFRTRRMRFNPTLPNVAVIGTLRSGPWITLDGMTWTPLAPHCVTLKTTQYTVQDATKSVLPCGVEDVVFDPLDPETIYVSGFELSSILLIGTTFEPGGIFKSTNFGASWARIDHGVPGFAASALTVIHQPGKPATIMAGHFQHADHDTGAAWSVAMSYDDGGTWKLVRFPKIPVCNRAITEASSDLVASLTPSPTDPRTVFAGTNGGVFVTKDGGAHWSLAFSRCFHQDKIYVGSIWGVAVTPDGKTAYAGVYDGTLWAASTSTPTKWRRIMTISGTAISSIVVDARDRTGRTMFVAALNSPHGVTGASVYEIEASHPSATVLNDSWASGINHEVGGIPHGPYDLVRSAPAYWITQSPFDSDVVYLSTTLSGAFWRSLGAPLPSPGSTPTPPTVVVPSVVPHAPGLPSVVAVPAVPSRVPTASPSPTLAPRR